MLDGSKINNKITLKTVNKKKKFYFLWLKLTPVFISADRLININTWLMIMLPLKSNPTWIVWTFVSMKVWRVWWEVILLKMRRTSSQISRIMKKTLVPRRMPQMSAQLPLQQRETLSAHNSQLLFLQVEWVNNLTIFFLFFSMNQVYCFILTKYTDCFVFLLISTIRINPKP